MRRALAWLAVTVVLGASCSGDPPVPEPTGAAERPRCDALPGRAPEGFVLVRTRDVPAPSHIGTRRSYREPGGARLEILLGAVGQVGEGLPLVEERELPTGEPARLLGGDGRWALVWEESAPCMRNGIIAEGMRRAAFIEVLRRMGLTP